jgi:uncharacterized protein (TIGR02145 family)
VEVYTNSRGEYTASFTQGCTADQGYMGVQLVVPGCNYMQPENVPIRKGQVTIKNFVFHDISETTIKGTVTDMSDAPVEGVVISTNGLQAVTDATGNYELRLESCFPTNPMNVDVFLQTSEIYDYSNGSSPYSRTERVSVTPGGETIQDFKIPEFCTVSGTITACDQIQDTAIIFFGGDNANRFYGHATNNGIFTAKFMNFSDDIPITVQAVEPNTRKILFYDTLIKVAFACPSTTNYDINMSCDTAFDGAEETEGCMSHNFKLGTVDFASTTQLVVSAANGAPQTIWSDVVMATGCDKSTFNAGDGDTIKGTELLSDCRRSSVGDGDFFSQCAMFRYANVLCPAPWRVPTEQDFVNLDLALGGTGENRSSDATILAKYMDATIWGGIYGGYTTSYSNDYGQGNSVNYWSSKKSASGVQCLYLVSYGSYNYIHPKYISNNNDGYFLRCVKD